MSTAANENARRGQRWQRWTEDVVITLYELGLACRRADPPETVAPIVCRLAALARPVLNAQLDQVAGDMQGALVEGGAERDPEVEAWLARLGQQEETGK